MLGKCAAVMMDRHQQPGNRRTSNCCSCKLLVGNPAISPQRHSRVWQCMEDTGAQRGQHVKSGRRMSCGPYAAAVSKQTYPCLIDLVCRACAVRYPRLALVSSTGTTTSRAQWATDCRPRCLLPSVRRNDSGHGRHDRSGGRFAAGCTLRQVCCSYSRCVILACICHLRQY
jgi:hypothetical protein